MPSSELRQKSSIYEPDADVRHFPAYAKSAQVLETWLTTLWADWVPLEVGVATPELCIQVRDVSDAFYGRKDGDSTIYLYLMESDIEDLEHEDVRKRERMTAPGRRVRGLEWSNTTGQLLHEMMHAYQYKVLKEASAEGLELFRASKWRWDGAGHDELFYTAIAKHAPYFGLTAEEFAGEL